MQNGYNGKLLRVDLTQRVINIEDISENTCRKYLGGAGFVLYFLLKELEQRIDALSPSNKLIFALGPLTGISLSGAGRNSIGTKSPLTGGIVLSEVGEHWGSELKSAGFDVLIVEGKSSKPVYLWINNGEAELLDASDLWGLPTKETQLGIRKSLNDEKIKVASIGPAGENLVPYACIMNGLFDAAGRGGAGAVMGSKNLKAVAVRGEIRVKPADSQKVKSLSRWFNESLEDRPVAPIIREYGTGAFYEANVATGNAPVNNFRDGVFDQANDLDAMTIKDTIRIGMRSCYGCILRCKKVVSFKEPYEYDSDYGGPEYEALAALGSNCGIGDLKTVCKANELCNALSLDAISTGSVISFAMECFENGLLTLEDTDGIELRFGNNEALLQTITLIAKRKGIGKLLSSGSAAAAKKIGFGADQFAIQVKGLELGMHEPRLKKGLGLGYMVNPHGGDHACNMQDTLFNDAKWLMDYAPFGYGEAIPKDEIGARKVALFRLEHIIRIVRDCMLLCFFCTWPPDKLAEITKAVTGWNINLVELLRIGERVLTMARMFNYREGMGSEDDILPPRFFKPKSNGALADTCLDKEEMEAAKRYYYVLMGWDEYTGVPRLEKLEELGLTWVR